MKKADRSGKKKVLAAGVIIVCLWFLAGVIDFSRVHSFERPYFCILSPIHAEKDGGSGIYVGLGYTFDIEGNFMPEDELPGITKYTARIFNIPVMSGIRD